jgi:hypothetical protein
MTNKIYTSVLAVVLLLSMTSIFLIDAQQEKPSDGMTQKQMEGMRRRSEKAMGFDQLKTTHHFVLASDGGSIQVEANDANDSSSRNQIRRHLRHIAKMFSEGNFQTPMLVHAQTPPGTNVMRERKAEISYKYKDTEHGAAIFISTKNTEALHAIHDFLRFQIKEHMTGDPLGVTAPER